MERVEDVGIWVRKYVMTAAAAAVALAFLRLLFRVTRRSEKKLRLPPGPKGYPLINNFLLLKKVPGNTPHQVFHRLSKEYGPLIYVKFGTVPAVIASSMELAKEILKTSDSIFASRRSSIQGEVLFYGHQDLICSPMGENTRFLRKICNVELFSSKRLQQFKHIRKEEVLRSIEEILNNGREGGLQDLTTRMSELTLNNITRILYGKRYFGKGIEDINKSKEFLESIEEYFVLGMYGLSDFMPYLRGLDLDGYEKAMGRIRNKVDDLLQTLINERREAFLSGQRTDASDFLDVLLQLQREKSSDGSLKDEQAKGLIWDLLLAGTDTSSHLVVWIIAVLMKYPEVFKKVQAELDSVVGKERLVEEEDLANLPYLHAVIKENFRLYPVSPITIPRKPIKATTLAGYDIPEDCLVMVNTFTIQRDPNLWKDPLKYDPDRFLESDIDHQGFHFEFLPFGSGRRMCPGMPLGMVMVELIFAQLVHACEISLPEGMKPEDVDLSEELRSVIALANPPKLLIRPRLPAHVYSEAGIEL